MDGARGGLVHGWMNGSRREGKTGVAAGSREGKNVLASMGERATVWEAQLRGTELALGGLKRSGYRFRQPG